MGRTEGTPPLRSYPRDIRRFEEEVGVKLKILGGGVGFVRGGGIISRIRGKYAPQSNVASQKQWKQKNNKSITSQSKRMGKN
jgi:hypothetical protein